MRVCQHSCKHVNIWWISWLYQDNFSTPLFCGKSKKLWMWWSSWWYGYVTASIEYPCIFSGISRSLKTWEFPNRSQISQINRNPTEKFLLPIEFLWTCSLQDTCFVGLLLWIKTPVSGEELLMSGTWTHSGLLELTQKLFDGWMVIWGTFRSHSPLSLVLWLDFCPAMVD